MLPPDAIALKPQGNKLPADAVPLNQPKKSQGFFKDLGNETLKQANQFAYGADDEAALGAFDAMKNKGVFNMDPGKPENFMQGAARMAGRGTGFMIGAPMKAGEAILSKVTPNAGKVAAEAIKFGAGRAASTPIRLAGGTSTPLQEAGDIATDTALGGALPIVSEYGGKAINAMKKVPSFLKSGTFDLSPENLTRKAEKLTTEVLQPSKGELARSLENGKQLPAVKQGAEAITKSKNYTDLRNNLDNHIKDIFDERNSILKQNNKPIGTSYIDNLEKYIQEQAGKGQSTPSEIQQMQDVLDREKAFAVKNPLDRISGQSRKEDLQDLTNTLLQKSEHGDVIDTQPARNRALNELRRGLKEAVEAGDAKIADLNSRYGGLRRAKQLIAGQEALINKEVPPHFLERVPIVKGIVNQGKSVSEGVMDMAVRRQKSLGSKTGKIETLIKMAKNP